MRTSENSLKANFRECPFPETQVNKARGRPDRARTASEGMPIPSGIMFLMYKFGRLVALVYICRTLAGGWGSQNRPRFYRSWWHHPRPRAMHKRAKRRVGALSRHLGSDPRVQRPVRRAREVEQCSPNCCTRYARHTGEIMVAPLEPSYF